MLPAILHNFIGTEYWVSDMNSIILTAFENKCPVNSFNILDSRITTLTKPKIDKHNMSMVYYWILQVYSISCTIETCSCLANVPTSFICCKARVVIIDLSFVCLHSTYITMVGNTNEIKGKVLLLYSATKPDSFSSTLQPYPWQGTHPTLVWAIILRWSE